jgi:hypothetical protein
MLCSDECRRPLGQDRAHPDEKREVLQALRQTAFYQEIEWSASELPFAGIRVAVSREPLESHSEASLP